MRKFCKTKLFSLLVFTIIILVNINEANVDLDAKIHLDDNSNATTLKKGVEGCFRADPGGNGYTYKWTKPSSSTSRKFYKSNNKGPIDFKCEVKKDGKTDIETKIFTWAEVIADQFTVTGADKIDDNIYATSKGAGNVTITLKTDPIVNGNTVPDDFISWTRGASGGNALTRIVSKANLIEGGVEVEAKFNTYSVCKVKIYVLPAKPEDTPVGFEKITKERKEGLADKFGIADRHEMNTPKIECDIYYKDEDKEWGFTFKSIEYKIYWDVNSHGRENVPDGNMNPFPYGFGMNDNHTQLERKTQAKSDLTPALNSKGEWKPPQDSYWSEALVQKHEFFHIDDWLGKKNTSFYKDKMHDVEEYIETYSVAVTKQNLLDYVKVREDVEDEILKPRVLTATDEANTEYNEDDEKRAYLDGKDDFEALANSINP